MVQRRTVRDIETVCLSVGPSLCFLRHDFDVRSKRPCKQGSLLCSYSDYSVP